MPPVPIVGSWMVWQVMAAWCSKVQVKLWSREGTALPPPCCPHTPCCLLYPGGTHSSYDIMGNNDAKREAWMDETNYRDNRQQADCAPLPWGWKYELHIHELAQGPSTQLSMGKRTAKQTGSKNGWRRKNTCPPFIKQSIVLSFVAETRHCEDTSRPWIQSQLFARLDKAFGTTGCIWGPVHNCQTLSSCFIRYIYRLINIAKIANAAQCLLYIVRSIYTFLIF